MAKITLADMTSGYQSVSLYNSNNTLIEAAIENTLSRDGTTPNMMEADLDMNSNRINNLTDGVNNQDAVTVYQLTNSTLGVVPAGTNISITDAGNYYAGDNVETILQELGPLVYPMTGYSIDNTVVSISSGAITIDYDVGNAYEISLTENITSITISNWPTSGDYGEIIMKFKQDATGSRTVSGWPAAVKWPGGTAPTITATATTGTDIVVLKTWDAGTTIYGDYSQDYS